MAIRDHLNRVAKLKAKIVTVDPPTGTIEAVGPDRQVRQVALFAVPPGFTWPVEGEYWSIYEENGYWRLGEKFLSAEEREQFQALSPGDAWRISEPWHYVGAPGEPAFQNGWTNYGGAFVPLRFMKDPHGFVHIEGFVKSGSTTADIFTLPAGYRPGYIERFVQAAQSLYGQIDVHNDGTVTHLVGSNADFSVNALFKAEA